MKLPIATFCLLASCISTGNAIELCSRSSPTHTVALLELYTSEGCSSCPPADKFLQNVAQNAGLHPDQVIPLALHVDYWDYIGWKDPFAKRLFTERQQELSAYVHSRTVYTPEFFINGKEFRNWNSGLTSELEKIKQQAALASIKLRQTGISNDKISIEIDSNSSQSGELHVALLENGLSSKVSAGENQGITLRHDAVARVWIDPIAVVASTPKKTTMTVNIPANANRQHLSLVAFIQNQQGNILQAVELTVCL
ncbi:DUF1223 domain-containing protein [Undibacterium jejuense]|uniref:DUF1223 domain-containing protein n=1 Tax=Undibacterium jejuense TaxID=1344949 RepID=A0A923HEV3_9BURK|nr:DUF1223 domain-containing protein [Undibacterium jejuense]MBC3863257.1 DUF1223 domain-containing protein [Undibacterium jejuense]